MQKNQDGVLLMIKITALLFVGGRDLLAMMWREGGELLERCDFPSLVPLSVTLQTSSEAPWIPPHALIGSLVSLNVFPCNNGV